MIIYWEDIRWEEDDAGTARATVADERHNTLMLESRDGKITFQTDGEPSFDASKIMEIAALCMVLAEDSTDLTPSTHHGRIVAETSQPGDADAFIPQQRRGYDPDVGNIEPEIARLVHTGTSGQARRGNTRRRA
jgi:hypothetical protein